MQPNILLTNSAQGTHGLTDHLRKGPKPWRWRKSPYNCKQIIMRTRFNIRSVLLTFILAYLFTQSAGFTSCNKGLGDSHADDREGHRCEEKDRYPWFYPVYHSSEQTRKTLTSVPEALLVAFSEHSPFFLCRNVLHAHLCLSNVNPTEKGVVEILLTGSTDKSTLYTS